MYTELINGLMTVKYHLNMLVSEELETNSQGHGNSRKIQARK